MSKITEILAIEHKMTELNDYIRASFLTDTPLINEVSEHLIKAGGKRLRPALLLLMAKAWKYQGDSDLNLAAVIEFIHTATLLHDDVVDGSLQRRGLMTANALWGNAPSVLVGDFLYSRAFQLMAKEKNLRVYDILASVTNTIAEGEVEQLAAIGNLELTIEDYYRIIYRKTAILFAASAQLGCLIGTKKQNATDSLQQSAHDYGENLGMAFQIMDDVLDYTGDAQALGKNLGDDLQEGKLTLPVLRLFSIAPEYKSLFQNIANGEHAKAETLIQALNQHDCFGWSQAKAMAFMHKAQASLEQVPDGAEKVALNWLARFAIERKY